MGSALSRSLSRGPGPLSRPKSWFVRYPFEERDGRLTEDGWVSRRTCPPVCLGMRGHLDPDSKRHQTDVDSFMTDRRTVPSQLRVETPIVQRVGNFLPRVSSEGEVNHQWPNLLLVWECRKTQSGVWCQTSYLRSGAGRLSV